MPLTAGSRLGAYEIMSALGAGGMGEVYRARDTKLDRDVAIKVLPELFVADPDRVARFQREAKTLAALNHPHIGGIFGLEEAEGVRALVLELVEGPTLADRIAQGPIPLEDALPIAKQVAEALEAAHEQGIIHRDLKPANVKLRTDGTVKVLDFGLAKALEPTSGAAATVTASPTITTPAMMTGVGVILGTAAYMAPEQAKGRPADKRSDVWAFGCTLYEMLTGKRVFDGEDVSEMLASVLKAQPDWTGLPNGTPTAIRRLLRRSLEKDPRRRLSDIADARLEIEEALAGSPESSDASGLTATTIAKPSRALPWIVAAGFAALVASILIWRPWRSAPVPVSQHLSVELGANTSLGASTVPELAISPDGNTLAFVGGRERQLYVRRLDQLQAVALTAAAVSGPFFSPDGLWVGFFSPGDRKLKKVAVTGGSAISICDLASAPPRGAWWGDDGYIVFNPSPLRGALLRVSSASSTPGAISTLSDNDFAHRWPQVLRGAKFVLFTAVSSTNGVDDARIVVQRLPSGPAKVVLRGGYYGRYLPNGHLVYVQGGTLFAVPFDIDRLEVTGQPVSVIQGILSNTESTSSWWAVSETGTLVYAAGQQTGNEVLLRWMGRDGATTPMRSVPADWRNPQFAPDGQRLALGIQVQGRGSPDIWLYEWGRDAMTPLTADPGIDTSPIWSPDGRSIVFASDRDRKSLNLYWQAADSSGEAHRLTDSPNEQRPGSWHPSGNYVAFSEQTSQAQSTIMILPIERSGSGWKAGTPTTFLSQRNVGAVNPMFSPDGRWLAYQSNEAGTQEVFVRPFPGPGGRSQVSTSVGAVPTWSRRRNELFYVSGGLGRSGARIMVVPYTLERDSFHAETPRPWSPQVIAARPGQRWFDLHPDGERFVVSVEQTTDAGTTLDKIVLVTHFFDELRRLTRDSTR
jgi:serine/threonine protein kinase/WD40 repeat protein